MEKTAIWYITDSDAGRKIAANIRELGLSIQTLTVDELASADISFSMIHIIILDIVERPLADIIALARNDERINSYLKFIVLKKSQIKQAALISMNMLHVEFISRPVNRREFILLLEKSIVVERYREMMKFVSKEAQERIDAFENLMDINRKDLFVSEKEKAAFEKIIEYEKHLMEEQARLNRAIRDFTFMRQRELFDMKGRIRAEEMLTELRRKELMDANSVIKAQESLINFSSKELHEANRIIDASEKVAELGRMEAISLHEQLKLEKEKTMALEAEVEKLRRELARRG